MRNNKHVPRGASLKRIEELSHLGTPDWIRYKTVVGCPGGVPVDCDSQHFSGLLRECSRFEYVDNGMIADESGDMHSIEELLDQAAERLDQAHEEWLEERKHRVRDQEPKPLAADDLQFLADAARDLADIIEADQEANIDPDPDSLADVIKIRAALERMGL